MANDTDVLRQVNRSGFPFQLGVEESVRATTSLHHWSVLTRECAWANPELQSSGFIDIVLKHNEYAFRMVIECKRVKDQDTRQLNWVFLLPDSRPESTPRASAFEVETEFLESGEQSRRIWESVSVYPTSHESEFCVLQGDEANRQPILERLAGLALESAEGLAEEETQARRTEPGKEKAPVRLFIFPAIVTNAKLAVCRFNPALVDLDRGILAATDSEISEVPFIRFRKSLASKFPEGVFYNVGFSNQARERTVFVVNASSLPSMLKDWQVGPRPGREFAIKGLGRWT